MAAAEAPRVGGFSLGGGRAVTKRPQPASLADAPASGRDFVTAIDGSAGLRSAVGSAPVSLRVIPAIANTFEAGVGKRPKRGVPSFLPDRAADAAAGGDRFEKAVENETAQAAGVAFGLNARARPAPGSAAAAAAQERTEPSERSFVARAMETKSGGREDAEAAALRDDLARLPDAADAEAYESMPVEAFGEAMLRGMGWTEGGGVGRNRARAPVKPIEYVPRPQLLGLGATPAAALAAAADAAGGGGKAKPLRPGESREPRRHAMLPVGEDGRVRNVRNLDEALVARPLAGCVPGKRMVIVGDGPHSGLVGTVVAVEKREGRSDRAVLRLAHGGTEVSVRVKEAAEEESREARAAVAARAAAAAGGGNGGDGNGRQHAQPPPQQQQESVRGGGGVPSGGAAAAAPAAAPHPPPAPWLAPHIRVRIVSTSLRGGALYRKKALVVDCESPTVCSLRLDDGGSLLDGVAQGDLETAPPRKQGRVAVVAGRWRGSRGKMLSRDNASQTAAVQLNASFQLVTLGFDDIAEYAGEADEHD